MRTTIEPWPTPECGNGTESYGAGETVCGVTRRHGLTSQQLFTCPRLARQTAPSAPMPTMFIPAVEPAQNRPVRLRLAPATGDSVLGLDLDWPARVAEVAPHFVAHSSTKFIRQGCQCLAGGSAAAFKRAVIRVE